MCVWIPGSRKLISKNILHVVQLKYSQQLDDNRVPSETLLIKWLQDHLTNDIKRIRALREARRCFARLATTGTNVLSVKFVPQLLRKKVKKIDAF